MVQKISRYANSQNKVTDADFFSNHPFHVEFEKLSKRIIAPAAQHSITQTMWYYERSRGKYNQEMFKMRDSERVAFQTKFPKNQVIKKEELGKYYNTVAMSNNEYLTMKKKENQGRYWIYRVFNIHAVNPQFYEIKKDFESKIRISPDTWRCDLLPDVADKSESLA